MSSRSVSALRKLGITHPIVQAPMAGTSTPELAAAVSNTGCLGSISLGASTPSVGRKAIEETRKLTSKPFNVNLFVHAAPVADQARENAWIKRLAPILHEHGVDEAPKALQTIYTSFNDSPEMVEVLLETKPPIVSFHFGLPSAETIRALKNSGCTLLASATSLDEALQAEAAGIDFIVAQGIEAGGHRGVFNPDDPDERLPTHALTRLLVQKTNTPIIAAGGIMDGAGIAAVLKLGAVAAQLGTAFVPTPESAADEGHRKALLGPGANKTVLTKVISGRPARSIANKFTELDAELEKLGVPAYPITYDMGKAVHAAAKAKGEYGYGAQWAGQGAGLARALPAKELVDVLLRELEQAQSA